MSFCTVAFNDHRRGLAYEADRAQIVSSPLKFLGFQADSTGIQPVPNSPVFDRLLERRHNNLKSLQKTIGSLQWFGRFVPNFTYLIKLILNQQRRANRLGGQAINFDESCKEAIRQVKHAIDQLPKLAHSIADRVKHLYVIEGDYAYAISI